MPLISIIVPVYKVESTINKCVQSILDQSFTDIELILVDDGSPDNCPAICDEWAKKESRIKVIHKSNGGLASARNAGMDIATGKYILFCDSDDYVNCDWCQNFLAFVSPTEDNFIFGGMILEYEGSQKTITKCPRDQKNNFAPYDIISLHIDSVAGFGCNVLYYSSIINKHHLRFNTEIIVEDLPFVLNYIKNVTHLTYTGFNDYHYIQSSQETLSRKFYSNLYQKYQEKYLSVLDFIETSCDKEHHRELKEKTADAYLYYFLYSLTNTFDKRNTYSFFKKIKLNNQIIHSKEFIHCINHASEEKKKTENPQYLKMLLNHNYFTIYAYQKLLKPLKWVKSLFKGH